MRSKIFIKASPERVWSFFCQAYSLENQGKKRWNYRILSLDEGSQIRVQWKTPFIRMNFTHTITPVLKGSEISYSVELQGILAGIMRLFLKKRIQKTLDLVLAELAKKLS